jgi:hypothetical protein
MAHLTLTHKKTPCPLQKQPTPHPPVEQLGELREEDIGITAIIPSLDQYKTPGVIPTPKPTHQDLDFGQMIQFLKQLTNQITELKTEIKTGQNAQFAQFATQLRNFIKTDIHSVETKLQ